MGKFESISMSLWSHLRMRGLNGGSLVAFVTGICLLISFGLIQPPGADATGDERTISLYEIHLKETTTVTFKRDGKFIPAALKKLNWAMRDWRTSVTTRMDPKLFDLIWQLQKDVGSTGPVHVISGHRSAKTNRKLRRKGGGQAKKSQHVQGRAMDVHFPGVSMSRVRKAAFVHEVGGVGYYPTSALPFVHVDTARVRSWPRMSRSQLAMLFPHGATKHRPSSGGPLNKRDRKKARIRLASLARKSRTKTLLANASIPRSNSGNTKTPTGLGAAINVASLTNNGYGTMEIPGVSSPRPSSYASKLWINKPGNKTLPSTTVPPAVAPQTVLAQADKGQYRLASAERLNAPSGNGSTHAKTQRATIQLASLAPERQTAARPNHNKNLWVSGAGQRAGWSTQEPVENNEPAWNKEPVNQRAIAQFAQEPRDFAALTPARLQPSSQTKFDAERVAYAPAFDAEHPDELSYRPFQILPLMSTIPVAQNKMLVAMVEPKYERVHELLASSENIPMQFRPSSSDAHALWNNQFKGKAILNIRQQALKDLLPTRPQRLARR